MTTPNTLFPELIARTRDLMATPGQSREEALALAIEHALDQGINNAIGHAVLSAAASGTPGLGERLAGRVITHSSRWTLPGEGGTTVSLTAIAVPLLVRYSKLPTFSTTAAVTQFEESFWRSGLFPDTSRVTLVPYLYTLDELVDIGFCHAEAIAFALAAKQGGILPPREDFADYRMKGGTTPELADGSRLHWLLGIVVDATEAPPPMVIAHLRPGS